MRPTCVQADACVPCEVRYREAGRRVLRLSVVRGHDRAHRAVGKKIATDQDFVTELLDAEGVAVVQGTGVEDYSALMLAV
jgi:hypothetical protein